MNDINAQWYWENILEREWLADIDSEEWFWAIEITRWRFNRIVNKEEFIKDIERKFWVTFEIDEEYVEINMKNLNWIIIWSIKTRYYSHWKVQIENHLEKFLDEDERSKWLWQAMYDVWKVMWFPIPKTEVSREPSNISFLLKNWYYISWKYDENWNEIDMSESEKIELMEDIKTLTWDLPFTYILKLS